MQAATKMEARQEEIVEVILIAGLISNSSVLANAQRIIDEKLEKCIPCKTEEVGQAKGAVGLAAGRKRK